MRTKFILTFLISLLFCVTYVYAEQGHSEHKGSMRGDMASSTSAVEVGNKICPVSGEKIGGAMGPGEQYEYQGKIYNFCCSGCIEEFKKNPEKYVKIVEDQMKGDMGQHMGMTGEGGMEGHHHMMGEKGKNMMMGIEKKH